MGDHQTCRDHARALRVLFPVALSVPIAGHRRRREGPGNNRRVRECGRNLGVLCHGQRPAQGVQERESPSAEEAKEENPPTRYSKTWPVVVTQKQRRDGRPTWTGVRAMSSSVSCRQPLPCTWPLSGFINRRGGFWRAARISDFREQSFDRTHSETKDQEPRADQLL